MSVYFRSPWAWPWPGRGEGAGLCGSAAGLCRRRGPAASCGARQRTPASTPRALPPTALPHRWGRERERWISAMGRRRAKSREGSLRVQGAAVAPDPPSRRAALSLSLSSRSLREQQQQQQRSSPTVCFSRGGGERRPTDPRAARACPPAASPPRADAASPRRFWASSRSHPSQPGTLLAPCAPCT